MDILTFSLISLIFFVLGAAVGSFLNVVVYRHLNEESWVKGRSKCEDCGKQIAWYDNIPLLSYLILGGKCRYCKKEIDVIHPVIEFLIGSLFVWWFWGGSLFFHLTQSPFTVLQPLFWLIIGTLLVVIFVVDLLYYIIPDIAVFSLLVITLLYRLILTISGIMQFKDLIWTMLAMLILVFLFYCLWYFTKGKGFGFGDVKLAAPLALLMGWPKTLIGIFLAFIFGAIVGIILIVFKKKKFGQIVPFGPFLILGTAVSLIFGEQIWQWYLSLLIN